mgnify:CR=1 FL=1
MSSMHNIEVPAIDDATAAIALLLTGARVDRWDGDPVLARGAKETTIAALFASVAEGLYDRHDVELIEAAARALADAAHQVYETLAERAYDATLPA